MSNMAPHVISKRWRFFKQPPDLDRVKWICERITLFFRSFSFPLSSISLQPSEQKLITSKSVVFFASHRATRWCAICQENRLLEWRNPKSQSEAAISCLPILRTPDRKLLCFTAWLFGRLSFIQTEKGISREGRGSDSVVLLSNWKVVAKEAGFDFGANLQRVRYQFQDGSLRWGEFCDKLWNDLFCTWSWVDRRHKACQWGIAKNEVKDESQTAKLFREKLQIMMRSHIVLSCVRR